MKITHEQDKLRLSIIFKDERNNPFREFSKVDPVFSEYMGGVRDFTDVTLAQMEELISNNFIDLSRNHNNSPTAEQFVLFVRKHPEFTFNGYVVTPDREDCRVTITGVDSNEKMDADTTKEFVKLFMNADTFDIDPPTVWYD